MQFGNEASTSQWEPIFCFANNIYNSDGGTHLTGFKTALTRVLNQYARKNGILQSSDANLTGDTIRDGLTAVISIRLTNPQFNSSSTVELRTIEVEGIVSRIVGKGLSAYLEENPEVARAILDKVTATVGKRPPNPQ